MSYLETTKDVYKKAAENPDVGLCCTTTPIWQLPELEIPTIMLEMNYGCGSTVNPRDLVNSPKILYVGVGGGMELLQFAYFSRQKGGVIGVDVVDEMLTASKNNFKEAEASNDWFQSDFVELKKGDALSLPVEDESIDVAAQNCLFNIFTKEDLKLALKEMYRVLKPHGRLVLSDPTCETEMPENLKADETLRALCLSGALSLNEYIKMITDAGFGKDDAEHHGLQSKIASWKQPGAAAAPSDEGGDELQMAKPKAESFKLPGKFPDMPWRKNRNKGQAEGDADE